jgi:hypothetical protein
MGGKGVKAKHCCPQTFEYTKFVDNDQQCFAFLPQANFPAHNLNFQGEGDGDEIKSRLSFIIFSTLRSIGVSNFNSLQLANIMKQCKIPVAVNQVECSLYFQQKKLRDNMVKMGIKLMAYGSLGSSGKD